jgi:hypothetical protein
MMLSIYLSTFIINNRAKLSFEKNIICLIDDGRISNDVAGGIEFFAFHAEASEL